MLPRVAVIVTDPAAIVVTFPFDPAELLMADTFPPDDSDQVADAVRFWVLPSE